MYKIAVLGDRGSVAVFSAVGFDVFEINDGKEASAKLRELAEGSYGVIFITEKLAAEAKKEIDKLKDGTTPSVILIPGVNQNTGEGMTNLSRSVERAVGKNILK